MAYVLAGIFVIANLTFWFSVPDRIRNTAEFSVASKYVYNNQEIHKFLDSKDLNITPVLIDSKKVKTTIHLVVKGNNNKTNVQITLKKQSNSWLVSKAMMKIEEPAISIMPGIISGKWKELQI